MAKQLERGVKIGRNQLCPCGSKMKYKYCCLKRIEEQTRIKLETMRRFQEIEKVPDAEVTEEKNDS